MEFLRFGSSIPGEYWGCCAADIIQNFHKDPDEKASIELVDGDGGMSLGKFAGPTYRDIFWQRLRYGTFSDRDMPNHGFIVMLSSDQVHSTTGQKWLTILKEAGFEFLRRVNNSVWDVDNYVFVMFRNVGDDDEDSTAVHDQFDPPSFWKTLPSVVPEPYLFLNKAGPALTEEIRKAQLPLYEKLPRKFLTEKEVIEAGAPVILAGKRSKYPQQTKEKRAEIEATDKNIIRQTSLKPSPGGGSIG